MVVRILGFARVSRGIYKAQHYHLQEWWEPLQDPIHSQNVGNHQILGLEEMQGMPGLESCWDI